MNNETALERLEYVKNFDSFLYWYNGDTTDKLVADIQELVALAKANQQPTIDAIRFEAAKAAMQGILAGLVTRDDFSANDILVNSVYYADALIAELQKPKS